MRLYYVTFIFLLLGTSCVIALYGIYNDLTINRLLGFNITCKQTEGGSINNLVAQTTISPVQQEAMIEAPCSLRKAVRNDYVLNGKFRFSVPVLLWSGSFSNHTWEQLKDKKPPYGWRGISVNDVNWTVSLLNSPRLFDRSSPDRCVRCAVVGNGGILRGSKQGKNIDSHDFVFRVNGAVIRGFEEDVGTKTSFYVFTTNTMKNGLKAYKNDGFTNPPQSSDTKYIFVPTSIRDYVLIAAAVLNQTVPSGFDKGDRPLKYFGNKPPDSFKILHPLFISNVTQSFLNSSWLADPTTRDIYRPSTGALMLLTALHTCDQVSAYGFITKNYAEFSDHYYDSEKKPLIFYANHDLEMEKQLWEQLHLKKVMTLYQRTAINESVHMTT